MSKFRPKVDVLSRLEPGEPYFVLRARDGSSAVTIKLWAHLWLQEIAMGLRPETDRPQIVEALRVATRMEIWHREDRQRREVADMAFKDRGIPTSGQHAQKERNTTSGANDL